jgi:hypothetical protein
MLVTAVALALMLLAGHPQYAVYAIYLSAALTLGWLAIDRPARRGALLRLAASGAAVALGVALAAITVLPMLELAEFSRRAEANWDLYIDKALPPTQLVSLILPLILGGFRPSLDSPVPYVGEHSPLELTGYTGLLPIGLALVGPFVLRQHRREARIWWGVTIVAAVLALGVATPLGTLFFYAPGYASFRVPARHLIVVTLGASVLAGLALADLSTRREARARISGAVTIALGLGGVLALFASSRNSGLARLAAAHDGYLPWAVYLPIALAAMYAAIGVAGRLTRMPAIVFAATLIVVHLADLSLFHYVMPGYHLRYAEISEGRLRPRPIVRELAEKVRASGHRLLAADGSQNRFLLPNLTRAWGIPSATGAGTLAVERYQQMMSMGGPGNVDDSVVSDAHVALDLFGVEYLLLPDSWDLTLGAPRWIPITQIQYDEGDVATSYTVYRNTRAMPRAWCAPEVVTTSSRRILAIIRGGVLPDQRRFDPAGQALVQPDVLESWAPPPPAIGEPRVVTAMPNERTRRYAIESPVPCMLVGSEVFYPWWRASLDSQPMTPVRVNHSMIGLPVPAGTHFVELRIEPTSIWQGAALSGAAFTLWSLVLVWPSATRKRAPGPTGSPVTETPAQLR